MINYYQQGGAANDQSEDQLLLGAVLGYIGYAESQKQDVSVEDAIAQVANIAVQDQETLQKLATNDQLVKVGQEKVENENPQILQQIAQPGVLKEIITKQIEQSNVQSARRGAKLNYLMKLKGICPAGYETRYYKTGGTICQVCVKKQQEREKVQSAKCGKKMKKGAISKAMNGISTEMFQNSETAKKKQQEREKVQSAKCGKKMKKGAISKAMNGISTEMFQNGGTAKKKPSQNIQVKTAKAPDGTIMKRTIIPAIDPANNDTIYSERVYYPGMIDENGNRVEGSGGYTFEPAGVYHWNGELRTENKNYQNLKNKFGKARIINTKNIPFTNNNADRYRGFSYTE